MSGGPNQLAKTREIYENVINSVCQQLQEEQENDTGEMAVEVIHRFKELWKKKIEERQVYLWNERDNSSTSNNESLKKESQQGNSARFSGHSHLSNSSKKELSEDRAQELIDKVNCQKDQFSKINHPNPNLDIQGNPIKKIKTEEQNSQHHAFIKQEDNSPSFGGDTSKIPSNNAPQQTNELKDFVEPILSIDQLPPVNLKIEDSEPDLLQDILDHQQAELNAARNENLDVESEIEVKTNKQENKNEQFLLGSEYNTEQHMYGCYSVMKKKTAKKFKISFDKIIASIGGKDYVMSTLCGDLEW